MNAPGLESSTAKIRTAHLIDMPHAAFTVLPLAALGGIQQKVRPPELPLDAGAAAEVYRRLVLDLTILQAAATRA